MSGDYTVLEAIDEITFSPLSGRSLALLQEVHQALRTVDLSPSTDTNGVASSDRTLNLLTQAATNQAALLDLKRLHRRARDDAGKVATIQDGPPRRERKRRRPTRPPASGFPVLGPSLWPNSVNGTVPGPAERSAHCLERLAEDQGFFCMREGEATSLDEDAQVILAIGGNALVLDVAIACSTGKVNSVKFSYTLPSSSVTEEPDAPFPSYLLDLLQCLPLPEASLDQLSVKEESKLEASLKEWVASLAGLQALDRITSQEGQDAFQVNREFITQLVNLWPAGPFAELRPTFTAPLRASTTSQPAAVQVVFSGFRTSQQDPSAPPTPTWEAHYSPPISTSLVPGALRSLRSEMRRQFLAASSASITAPGTTPSWDLVWLDELPATARDKGKKDTRIGGEAVASLSLKRWQVSSERNTRPQLWSFVAPAAEQPLAEDGERIDAIEFEDPAQFIAINRVIERHQLLEGLLSSVLSDSHLLPAGSGLYTDKTYTVEELLSEDVDPSAPVAVQLSYELAAETAYTPRLALAYPDPAAPASRAAVKHVRVSLSEQGDSDLVVVERRDPDGMWERVQADEDELRAKGLAGLVR